MLSYFLRRLILVLPVAFGVSVVCFALVQIAPGDPLTAIMPVDATAEQQAAMRAAYGLDKPVPVQYLIWVGNLLQGEMGRSIASGRPVAEVFGAVGNSLLLAAAAAVIAFPIGIFLGFLAGYFRDTALDRAVTALSITGVSVPELLAGDRAGHHLFGQSGLAAVDGRGAGRVAGLAVGLGAYAPPGPARGDAGGGAHRHRRTHRPGAGGRHPVHGFRDGALRQGSQPR